MLKHTSDRLALAALLILWGLFFWRVATPFESDQLSFAEGDFSAQFVTWTNYAVERLDDGELPLWNPYNYGGAPFQASSQTALTYPPHMLTLGALTLQSEVQPWEVYAAMQWEVMLHVLLASLFMYVFVRELLCEYREISEASFGGLIAGLSYAYGGYLAGYPILQAPLLEAGIWLPLVLLGILWGTRDKTFRPRGMIFGGAMFGISLLAGHPQTSLFIFYMALAFLAYRAVTRGWHWSQWLLGALMIGGIGAALAAVQLIPTAEFSLYTSRTQFSFEAKAGGYSFEELSNLLFPIRGRIWNSNHFGILPLLLAGVAVWRRSKGWGFFTGVIVLAFLLTFGARTPVYGLLYPLVPGLSFFRGQERAVYLLAFSLAVLAGLGAAETLRWASWREAPQTRVLCRVITGLTTFTLLYAVVLYVLAQTDQRSDTIVGRMEGGFGTLLILAAIRLSWGWYWHAPADANRRIALAGLLVLDLFSVTMMLAQNYQAIPVRERLVVPAAVAEFREALEPGGRIESHGGLEGGYGTLYHLPDVYGSDPLQLESTRFYLEDLSAERRRELLAVRAYYADGSLQKVENPRGFAHLVYAAAQVQTLDEARGLVREPALDLRQIAVIEEDPGIPLDAPESTSGSLTLEEFAPERIELRVENEQPALLTLALPYFPGWQATVDGEEVEILRTYAGLSGLALTEGQHDVILMYESRWLALAAVLSLVAMIGVLGGLVFFR